MGQIRQFAGEIPEGAVQGNTVAKIEVLRDALHTLADRRPRRPVGQRLRGYEQSPAGGLRNQRQRQCAFVPEPVDGSCHFGRIAKEFVV